jgi:transcriptional regulator with XRE-family HTH domain
MAWRATVWIAPEEHKAVGKILAEFRKKAGLRQQDLAARLNKPQSFVSSYEAGQRRVDVLELLRIAVSMGANPQEVFAAIAHQQGIEADGK